MSKGITESVVELAALDWLLGLGYEIVSGLTIAPGESAAVPADSKQVLLFDRLQTNLEDLNPKISLEGLEETSQDALLPRMLLGELRVPAAAKLVRARA
jgi:type I restriction enzyme R subunit